MTQTILVVDDEEDIRRVLTLILTGEGFKVITASSGDGAIKMIANEAFDLALIDIRLGKDSGFELLKKIATDYPDIPTIMITAFVSVETAVNAIKLGASDYVTKPFINDDVIAKVCRLLESKNLKRRNAALEEELSSVTSKRDILIGQSEAMATTVEMAKRVASTKSNILLTGETGVGKGLLARMIHGNSDRAKEPFLEVNCGAIPESLMESQFFGHVKGSFTGAHADSDGLFVKANGGTILLDEIGELPPQLQVKLLTALQERTITPVGATTPKNIDVRIIAATNRDLAGLVKKGAFREDLYYRINVIDIHIPPLRNRSEDIELLITHFLEIYSRQMGKSITRFSPKVISLFKRYSWPGNIRELQNIVERATVISVGDTIDENDIPERLNQHDNSGKPGADLKSRVAHFEKALIQNAIESNNGDKVAAANELDINLATLYRKLGR